MLIACLAFKESNQIKEILLTADSLSNWKSQNFFYFSLLQKLTETLVLLRKFGQHTKNFWWRPILIDDPKQKMHH